MSNPIAPAVGTALAAAQLPDNSTAFKQLTIDTAGADAMGLVAPAPAPLTLLGRLKALFDVFSRTTSATDIIAVAASDTVALAIAPKALLVTGTGNLALKGASGVAVTIPVLAGQLLPIQPIFVMATGTTATVVALV